MWIWGAVEIPRAIGIGALIFLVPPIAIWIGRQLEKLENRHDRPFRAWLYEIGSDIRWLLIFLSFTGAIVLLLSPYFIWVFGAAKVLIKISFSVFFLLVSIAASSVFSDFFRYSIDRNNLTKNDRRNLLTLLPIAFSAIKLAIYFVFCILLLASLGVDVRPFLEVGGIALIILGLAGQSLLADMLSTLFIFTDRLFYVGDRLSFQCGDNWIEGTVISISLRYTIIEFEQGKRLAIANRQLDKFQKLDR